MNQFIFVPPLEPDDMEGAFDLANDALLDKEKQTVEALYDALDDFFQKPTAERLAWYVQHEPVQMLDPMSGQLIYSPYWQVLISIDPQRTKRHLQDYAKLQLDLEKKNGHMAEPAMMSYGI